MIAAVETLSGTDSRWALTYLKHVEITNFKLQQFVIYHSIAHPKLVHHQTLNPVSITNFEKLTNSENDNFNFVYLR